MFIKVDDNRLVSLKHVALVTKGEKDEVALIILTTDVLIGDRPVEYVKGYETVEKRDAAYERLLKDIKEGKTNLMKLS